MKTYAVVLLTGLLFSTAFLSQSPQESPELKEATELTERATKLLNEGKADEAIPLAKRALQIREKLLPPTDLKISISLNYLGNAYARKGDYSAAAQALDRLLKILEGRFGAEDVNLLPTLNRLAVVYNLNDNERKAEEVYQRVLVIREKVFGVDSAEVAQTCYDLGELYRKRGDFARSLSNYKRSLLIYGRLSGIDTPDFERVSKGFYCLHHQSEKPEPLAAFMEIRRQLDPQRSMLLNLEHLESRAMKVVQPEYPPEARERRLSGTVYLWLELDDEGNVASATDMCQGPPYLIEAALKAALKSRFRASKITVSGVPVKIKGIMSYRFHYR
jgi:tetratricopeptide (TPR) repeat protein